MMGGHEKPWEVLLIVALCGLAIMDCLGVFFVPFLHSEMRRNCNELMDGTITGVRAVDAFRCDVDVSTLSWNDTVRGVECKPFADRLTDYVVVMFNHFDRGACIRFVIKKADIEAMTAFSDQRWWMHLFMWCWLTTVVIAACVFVVLPAVRVVIRRVSGTTYGSANMPIADLVGGQEKL